MKMREIMNIVEARTTLPLQKDAANLTYGGRQPSLIVVMPPLAFLRLTTGSKEQYQDFLANEPQQGRPDSLDGKRADHDKYALPLLHVDRNGKVTEHDGRHRAALIVKAGGNKLPVAMIFDDPAQTTLPPVLFSQFLPGVKVATAGMKAAPPKPLRAMHEPDIDPELAAKADDILAQWRNAPL